MENATSYPSARTSSELLGSRLLDKGWSLACAESCTGGLISSACTEISGSSQWFERGFVTYSNAAKHELLGVDWALIERHGAVSEEVARAMALGALRHSRAQVALAVTGVAGPTGGRQTSPWAQSGSLGGCRVLLGPAWALRVRGSRQSFVTLRETAPR